MTRGSPGLAQVLDAALDAAAGAGGPFSAARSARLDALEEFPAEECALLDACGIARAYVPAELGGAPGGLPELVASLRTVARRDLTVAVAHGKTFLGAVCTWIAGDQEQRATLARQVRDEGTVVSWGLTEPGRGSDLLAGQLVARPMPGGGWRLSGVKWPVNNATRGRLICVLARTSPEGGPRGFSLFLVDKDRLPAGSWQPMPKEPTHGIRGADISGIRFEGAPVPDVALIGRVGDGVETVLRALQLTRTVCASLSLGAGDHALRLAYAFARQRRLYGTTLITLPLARRVLGRAAASLELARAASLVGARAAHCLPGEMSVVSALVKAGVPHLVQRTIDELAELMGARGFLVKGHADGMFQKLERDHRVVAVFDGSTAVNRAALAAQFPTLARLQRTGAHDVPALAALRGARGAGRLPALDPAALRLTSRRGCSVVQGLPAAVDRLARLARDGLVPSRAHVLARAVLEEASAVAEAMAALPPASRATPAAAFDVARRYELCFAAASAVQLLIPPARDPARAVWLTAALERALELLRPGHEAPDDVYEPLLVPAAAPPPARRDEEVPAR
ncbi:acyl-CoA dehydrogenase [Streptomyces sp. NBC_00365]|uniref:acyl-CoA dehydrogenase n=1 Tax=Streptomyces sp. NBC_00365 TaxID=2975726 RepID=UPI00225BAC37|nr:acyl-CoA dehydrogenase [Streptomyces sp. NBC_00365]MCX5096706.1 acyl-CoA dehydrogenase [Streptomyces sp. NBC_00365]